MSVLSVLIVEDKEDTADSTAELLALLGHVVRIARCGEDGLREALTMTPDLILLDIGLPRMNGWEVAERLRKQTFGKQPFIVAVTGYGTDGDRWCSAEAGIDMHLIKPVAPQGLSDLLKWVGECLDGADMPPMRGLIRVCAWCRKVYSDGEWRVAEPSHYIAITHGMCPDCFDGVATSLLSATQSC